MKKYNKINLNGGVRKDLAPVVTRRYGQFMFAKIADIESLRPLFRTGIEAVDGTPNIKGLPLVSFNKQGFEEVNVKVNLLESCIVEALQEPYDELYEIRCEYGEQYLWDGYDEWNWMLGDANFGIAYEDVYINPSYGGVGVEEGTLWYKVLQGVKESKVVPAYALIPSL